MSRQKFEIIYKLIFLSFIHNSKLINFHAEAKFLHFLCILLQFECLKQLKNQSLIYRHCAHLVATLFANNIAKFRSGKWIMLR